MNPSEAHRFWQKKARFVLLRQNLGCWLEAFLPALLVSTFLFASTLLILRKMDARTTGAWFGYGAALFTAAVIGFMISRRKFFTKADALVRLEAALHLHNRLTAAAAGVGDWPAPIDSPDAGLRWRFEKIFWPVVGSALLVWAATSVPLFSAKTDARPPTDQPLAWSQVQSWTDALEKEKLVEKTALEKLRAQLDELRIQDPDQWYNYSSLEAGDNLRQETEQSLRALQHDLQSVADALAAAQKFGDQMSAADLQNVNDALKKALQGLQLGNLPLNKELLAQLENFDPSKIRQLTPEQLAELQKRLKEGAGVCGHCLGNGGDKNRDALMALINQQTGSGGPGGGGGPAPLNLKKDETQLGTNKSESIANDDLTRATPGDLLGVSKGEHEVNKNDYSGPVAAGAIQSLGQGGETVWKDELTPQERDTLQRFFK